MLFGLRRPSRRLRRKVPAEMEETDAVRPALCGRERVVMGILVGGALLFRLLFLGCHRVLAGDEIHYAESLFRFLNGRFLEGVSDYWSFMYPFAATPFGFLAGDAETGLRLLSAISGAALVVPAFLIAHRLWGQRAAVFAGLLVALQPNLISFSSSAVTEPLYSFLLLCTLLLFLRGMETGAWRRFAAAGVILGFAYLTRPETAVLLVAFMSFTLLGWGSGGLHVRLAARVRCSIVMAALFCVVLTPHFFLLHAATGRWTAGSKAAVNLSSPVIWQDGLAREEYVYSLNDECTASRNEALVQESALRILWRQRGAIASRYFGKMEAGFDLLPIVLSSPLLLILVPLGLFGRRWETGSRGPEALISFLGLFPFVFFSLFKVEFRYLIPYLPIYLLWAGVGCGVLLDWFKESVSARRLLRSMLVALVFLSLVPYTIHKYVDSARSQPREWVAIGRWIGEHEGHGARILAQPGCSISYYAGNPTAIYIPWTDAAGLVRFARHNRFGFVAVDEDFIRAKRPTLSSILDSPPGDFELVREFELATGGRVILYRLVGAS
jgi:hypothetical protein